MKLHRLAALFVVACGSPQGLDEDAFPDQYAQGAVGGVQQPSGAAGAGVLGGGAGAGTGIAGAGSSLGNAGSPGVGAGGAGGSGNVNPPASSAGAGGGAAPSPPVGSAGAGQTQTPPPPPPAGCDAAAVLATACGTAGCHSAAGIPPDLASAGLEARVVDVASTCNGLPYIGATDSFLLDKLDPGPPCGVQMPLIGTLSADDRACIESWAAEVGGGG